MKLVVLGLSLSSSWGNGHATTYRALLKAFAKRGHDILFLERDVPWYRNNRDIGDTDYCRLEWQQAMELDRDGRKRKLVPIRIVPYKPDSYLQQVVYIDIVGLAEFAPGKSLTMVLHHADGTNDKIKVNHTYNEQQIEWFKAGSALNLIRKQFGKA